MRIGILGGTFNPPHTGHLILANTVRDTLRLDRILFVPVNTPPHKKTRPIAAHHRLTMLKRAVRNNTHFKVLDLEIKRQGTSYTIDTIDELKKRYPNDSFYLIIGSDLIENFGSWKEWRRIRRLTKVVVASRKKYPFRKKKGFIVVAVPQIEITASMIRDAIQKRKSIQYLVPPAVCEYIRKHRLY